MLNISQFNKLRYFIVFRIEKTADHVGWYGVKGTPSFEQLINNLKMFYTSIELDCCAGQID